ncbi:MAG: hypothetical protein AUJ34_01625 [Parcubacteria group bacterium CG1_02_41_12]|nr:MAG: hypothetical protein AUJ34_01625 [Parcubacteria group bacterium CG1_02_41_12]
MTKTEEKQLIARAKKNPDAFGAIFEQYYEPIFGYVLKRTGNVHSAQDIVSETFFKALDRLWQFRWQGVSISSWLYRIATNEINQYYRKRKKAHISIEELIEKSGIELQDEHDLIDEISRQEEELERAHQWRKARKYISELDKKYQEVLSLRFFEEKKINEISEILNKKEGTVKSLLSRGMAQLRGKMSKTQPNSQSRILDTRGATSPASEKS